MVQRLLSGSALVSSVVALLIGVWIVVPAQTYRLSEVAVGASEWSLWLVLLGGLGATLGAAAAAARRRWAARAALVLGLVAAAIALVPSFQAWRVAQANSIQLSLRDYFAGLDRARPLPTPETATYVTVDGQALKLDVFRPHSQAGQRPAIIVVHGGSWSAGDKTDFPQWDAWLAEQGFAVFDIQYRLAPQPNWQTAAADVKCAVGWVRQHSAEYGVDPRRIALLGRSAGGQLALLAAYTPGNPALPPSCSVPDTRVQAVVALYGPTDLVWGYNNPANPRVIDGPGTLRRYLGGTPESAVAAYRLASPVSHVGSQTPPTLLLHGSRDQLVSQRHAERLAERLMAEQVPHRTVFIPYGQHGFDYNFHGWSAQITKPVLLAFLETYLADQSQRQK